MSNRISRLFSRERDENQSVENSQRNSSACSVPLFMSPPSDQFRPFCVGGHSPHAQRYHEGQAPLNADEHDRQSTIAASSVYSESPRQQQEAQFTREDIGHRSQCSSSRALDTDLEDRSSSPFYADSEAQIIRDKQRKKRRVTESTRQRIASKKRLSMAFGITVLATVITCESRVGPFHYSMLMQVRPDSSRNGGCSWPHVSHSFDLVHSRLGWSVLAQLHSPYYATEASKGESCTSSRLAWDLKVHNLIFLAELDRSRFKPFRRSSSRKAD